MEFGIFDPHNTLIRPLSPLLTWIERVEYYLWGQTSQKIEVNARTGFALTLFCKLYQEPTETNIQEISKTYPLINRV